MFERSSKYVQKKWTFLGEDLRATKLFTTHLPTLSWLHRQAFLKIFKSPKLKGPKLGEKRKDQSGPGSLSLPQLVACWAFRGQSDTLSGSNQLLAELANSSLGSCLSSDPKCVNPIREQTTLPKKSYTTSYLKGKIL